MVQLRMPAVEAVSSRLGCSSGADKLLLAALVGCRRNFEPTAAGKPGLIGSWWAAGGAEGQGARKGAAGRAPTVGQAPETPGK